MKRNQPSVESVQNRALQAFLPKLESSVSPSSLPFSHPSLIHPSRPSAGRDRGALTSCLQPTHGISIVENRRHALSLSRENTARLQAWTGGGVNTTPPVRCQSCLITGIGNQSFGLSSFPWRNDLYRWHVDNEGTCIIIGPTGPQPLYFAPLSVSLPPLTSLLLFPLTPHPRPSLFDGSSRPPPRFYAITPHQGPFTWTLREAWGWLESRGGMGQGLKCFSQKVQVINETRCLIDRLIKCSRCFSENDATFWGGRGILFPRGRMRVVLLRVIEFNECSLLQGGIHFEIKFCLKNERRKNLFC